MAEVGRRYNPNEKKPKNTGKRKMDKVLNLLIGIVVVLILIVAATIVIGGSSSKDSANEKKVANNTQHDTNAKDENIVVKDSKELEKEKAKKAELAQEESSKQDQTESDTTENVDDTNSNEVATNSTDNTSDQSNTGVVTSSDQITSTDSNTETNYNYQSSETAKQESSDDPNVIDVVTDPAWKPTKTSQKDNGSTHASSYNKGTVDWNEKIKTIAKTTGLHEKDMIVWYVKNGGSPDTSIGIVSSKDKEKSYRVSMKWVSNKGWQPTKLEVLKTYKGAY
ncbi:DUF1510 family protein [Rummeliibacillus sp. JY-2-4R]